MDHRTCLSGTATAGLVASRNPFVTARVVEGDDGSAPDGGGTP